MEMLTPDAQCRHANRMGVAGLKWATLLIAGLSMPNSNAQNVTDAVTIPQLSETDEATLVISRRQRASGGACVCSHQIRAVMGPGPIDVSPELGARRAPCGHSQIFALAGRKGVGSNTMPLDGEDGPGWRDGRDPMGVSLKNRPTLKLKVWMAKDVQPSAGTMKSRVDLDVNRAVELLNERKGCGIEIKLQVKEELDLGNRLEWGQATASALMKPPLGRYETGSLNVYYVLRDPADPARRGNWIELTTPDGNRGIILVYAKSTNAETLAHEIGHALALGHMICAGDSCTKNVMHPDADLSDDPRERFELGQCIRMHFRKISWIASGRNKEGEWCDDGIEFPCPPIDLSSDGCR